MIKNYGTFFGYQILNVMHLSDKKYSSNNIIKLLVMLQIEQKVYYSVKYVYTKLIKLLLSFVSVSLLSLTAD